MNGTRYLEFRDYHCGKCTPSWLLYSDTTSPATLDPIVNQLHAYQCHLTLLFIKILDSYRMAPSSVKARKGKTISGHIWMKWWKAYPRRRVVIWAGFNGHVGEENKGDEDVMGSSPGKVRFHLELIVT